ncbi:MAG: DNA-directed RNA polymerase subunit beta [Candidatus Amesbacteria bacterium GW2011_GWC2_47_8]|uniref:DNA-directed RNA polymerase n=1 Tax=Candidatus Amesbacteria bacterium GW2011_GWC2_47_8 TaxID=1618367 RepID=A0A0G1TMK7_9BACT|nr:MAG: DNA-directed RNA polymerase subunit beta [Candidatus Amesbacteria bacterium GW2011_GWC2_47_8]
MPVSRRLIWGQEPTHLPPLNLTQIQLDSWLWFISDGIKEAVAEISPIEDFTGKNWLLEFGQYSIEKPGLSPLQATRKGLTYSSALRIHTKLTNKQTKKTSSTEVFLGDIPQMTPQGTFVINGVERAVVNQIVRSPGVYFGSELDAATGKLLYSAELRPIRGTWLEFEVSKSDVISIRVDRRRKFLATTILRAMGLSEYPDGLEAAAAKDTTKTTEDALIEVYKKMRPGEPVVFSFSIPAAMTWGLSAATKSTSASGLLPIPESSLVTIW